MLDEWIFIPKSDLPFNPVYWALDFHERISDAITDQWILLKEKGDIQMDEALIYWKRQSHFRLRTVQSRTQLGKPGSVF